MDRKARVFGLFIKLIALAVFVVYEYRIYTEYKKNKSVLEFKKSAINKEIKDSFLLRKEGFYLDKTYLKQYEELKKNPPENVNSEDYKGGIAVE